MIGHSLGGLLTQILAGRGLPRVSVAIDPAPFRGVLPLPVSALKSGFPVLHSPANRSRAVPPTYEQFRYSFANASYQQQQHNPGVTEIVELKGRGHALTIDHGWREIADAALGFVERFTQAEQEGGSHAR